MDDGPNGMGWGPWAWVHARMTAPALMRYLPLTLISTQQLIQLSVIFELVGSESEKLLSAVYSIPWECMDTSNRKFVSFFLMNAREPIHVKALGIANVGVMSMAANESIKLPSYYKNLSKFFNVSKLDASMCRQAFVGHLLTL
ncbi:unnamed protein product [Spodoptera littoralis]|uniref:Uncharacterized protein n=1 Tax=Spodoptera littoralis TaxID=7109 RepID=A0A9P0HV00_SPOLI|nr:unnamed protein product [Spodoptera littoralis]CAH1634886.1 unnamed protein product [Spodoptera littoralis]